MCIEVSECVATGMYFFLTVCTGLSTQMAMLDGRTSGKWRSGAFVCSRKLNMSYF